MGQQVRWRSEGHRLSPDDQVDVLRFEITDLNQVIKSAAAASPLYIPLLAQGGLAQDERVLPLSCFAVTSAWTPYRLARDTHFRSYRLARAGVLADAGYRLWPTAVFQDGVGDPRNEVHYDLIVASGPELRLGELAGGRAQRTAARERLAPAFRAVLALFGDPLELGVLPQ